MAITYRLIDTDHEDAIAATADTLAGALESGLSDTYMPGDFESCETWADVAAECERHVDGVAGVVEGYTVERIEATTYRIEQRVGSTWTADGIGESRGWPSATEAIAAAMSLARIGPEWHGRYRIVEETTGATVSVLDVE